MTVIVTTSWDDGHILDLRLAELLDAHGVPGTFYIAPRSVEIAERLRLSDHHIRQLAARFEIGGHTLNHVRLPSVPLPVADEEIRLGKSCLEDVVQLNLDSFCYPGGEYGTEHIELVRRAGFVVARTVRRWVRTPPADLLQVGTTAHAYRHLKDLVPLAHRHWRRPHRLVSRFRNWDDLAVDQFNQVALTGGFFHLWGHSWEVDADDDWQRLERVLRHIGGRSGVRYLTNGALAHESGQALRSSGGDGDEERSA